MYGMLSNGNRAVRTPLYEKAAAISDPPYVENALYRNRVLRVPRYRRAVAISAPRYMGTAFGKYHVVGWLTVVPKILPT